MPRSKMYEKSKDFKGSMTRLFNSLNNWRYLLIVALILAIFSAVLSIVAPNQLSKLTDAITEGIKPNTKILEQVNSHVQNNMTEEKINNALVQVLTIDLSSNIINSIMNDENISVDDKNNVQNLLDETNQKDLFSKLIFLKDDTLKYLFSESTYNDVVISVSDKIDLLKSLFLENGVMPLSFLTSIFSDIKINNIIVTKEDFAKYITLINNLDMNNQELKNINDLPNSIYNLVKPAINMVKVKNITLLLTSLYLCSALFSYIQSFSMATISNNFARSLRKNISRKINRLPLKYFDSHETGDVLSRVTNDVDTIGMQMNNSLASLVSGVTLFLGSIIMMFVTEWRMALTAILSSVIGFAVMFIILGKSQKYFNQRQQELGALNGYIEEMYSGHNIVKAYNGDKDALKEFDDKNIRLSECSRKSQFLSGIMHPMMGFVGNLGYVAVCVVGALLAVNNIITFGVIVAFMIYVRLFTNPLSQMAQSMTALQSTAAAAERVFEFVDENELPIQDKQRKHLDKTKAKGEIEFRNVKFGYNVGKTIIKDFSFKANPGQKIAIVGPTGAGKTTLVNLLMKFYEITGGDILIDGISINNMTRENIHDMFVMVLQDTWLFDGTIRDNIKFNNENITDEDIWNALRIVGIDHFVRTLPKGLDSQVGDNENISQGQKQLLTISRGMVKDAPFLILDEATSNVDTRTEEIVQKAMDILTEGKTSFIIAHRLSTIKNADLILVMKEGNIIEQGNHEQLMKQEGFYYELYNSQFQL